MLGALGIWAVFASTAIDLGMGQTSFNTDTATYAQAIFAEGIGTFMLMFAILGIVDSKSPSDLAGIVIGGVVVAIIMVIGPLTGASLNPARAFGPELVSAFGGGVTHWAQLIPVYVLPGLAGRRSPPSPTTSWPSRVRSRDRSRRRSSTTPTRAPSRPRSEMMHMATATPTMRKLLNDPAQVVKESLAGLAAAHGDILRVDADAQIVVRADAPRQGKVALLSGGGAGHEPMHGGFVGMGMLDAACPGEVFTSPVPDQMLAATKAVDGGAGVLHLVKNYTGDVMNFKLAAEDAADEGIDTEHVLIDDDVAVQDSLYTAGRRGVGATVLAEKLAGAAAERGDDLAAVTAIARRVNERSRSYGVALSSCIPPASGKPIFDLPAGEMEVGVGIHGEPGRSREPLGTAHDVAGLMVQAVVEDLAPDSGSQVLVFTNSLGGTRCSSSTSCTGRSRGAARARAGARPPPRRPVHHVAGDGRRVADAVGPGRRARLAVGCSRPHRRAPLGCVR